MQFEKEECIHIADVLRKTESALLKKDAPALKNLSNMIIHSACDYQSSGAITTAVLVYSLSKIIEREDYKKIKNWDVFVKKFNAVLDLAISALEKNFLDKFDSHIEKARKTLESQAINLKPYIQDVLKKSAINKGSKIYEHGVSLERTAKLLGITQWELSEYIGSKSKEEKVSGTLDVKKRARMALEFFS